MMTQNTALDETLFALSDATRRAILAKLYVGEARVTDLAEPFSISLNSVSKHIRILERAGLVSRRKSGRDHILTFNPAPLVAASAWLEDQPKTAPAASETPAKKPANESKKDDKSAIDGLAALMVADSSKKKGWLPW